LAEKLIGKLQLGDQFSSTQIPNPSLQRHFRALHALALGECIDGASEEADMECLLEPENREASQAASNFKAAIFGKGDGDEGKVLGTAAKKRKASLPPDLIIRFPSQQYNRFPGNIFTTNIKSSPVPVPTVTNVSALKTTHIFQSGCKLRMIPTVFVVVNPTIFFSLPNLNNLWKLEISLNTFSQAHQTPRLQQPLEPPPKF